MKNLLLLTISIALLSACASADKMLERGDYDGLVRMATKKLSGNKKKDDLVIALEKGFEKITKRDMATIEFLKVSDKAEDWEDIMDIARDIDHRQELIEPLLPLISVSGYHAKFTFVHTDQILSEAKITAVNLYEKRLEDMVVAARKGNKKEARQAFNLIDHICTITDKYYRPELRDEMWNLGINKILLQIENNSNVIMPAGFEEEILSADFANMGGSWDRYYTEIDEDMKIDYKVLLRITDIATTHDEWKEIQHPYSKNIVDGWEYVLDDKGNVKKDSLGNDIKRDKHITVNATVVETLQSKKALIRARMDITNVHTGARVYSQPLEVEDLFNHTARNFFGDERALDNELRVRIPPATYPSDASIIWDAFKGLKPKFFDEVRRANFSV
ncbi:MAG TPA: hypothetical protein VFG10_15685 [Saprospiraceae bacterium]|nr:hypothetical protein [Saprospiraceae bacterium]